MSVFVDTSALYALLDADDASHTAAAKAFRALASREDLVTHSYVAVETIALTRRRLGREAVRAFARDLAPLLGMVWVDERLHDLALATLLDVLPTDVSLVDLVSFQVMREQDIARAFAFDRDFRTAGFSTIP